MSALKRRIQTIIASSELTPSRKASEIEKIIRLREREAAARALEEAANDVAAKSEAYAVSARRMHDDNEMDDSSRYFNYAAGLNMAVPVLRNRAAEMREGAK